MIPISRESQTYDQTTFVLQDKILNIPSTKEPQICMMVALNQAVLNNEQVENWGR